MLTLDIDYDALAEAIAERLQPTATSSPWLTVKEAAEYAKTTPAAIYKRIKRGQLQSYRPEGSPILLHRDTLDGRTGPRAAEVLC